MLKYFRKLSVTTVYLITLDIYFTIATKRLPNFRTSIIQPAKNILQKKRNTHTNLHTAKCIYMTPCNRNCKLYPVISSIIWFYENISNLFPIIVIKNIKIFNKNISNIKANLLKCRKCKLFRKKAIKSECIFMHEEEFYWCYFSYIKITQLKKFPKFHCSLFPFYRIFWI